MTPSAPSVPREAIHPNDYLSPRGSIIAVYGVMIPATLIVIVVVRALVSWHRRLAARAEASVADTPFLAPGESVLHGEVELEEGASLAVRTTLHQQGTEHKVKHGWKHRWTEVRRDVHVNPFFIVDGSGKRIRVEPDETVLHVDEAPVTERRARDQRIRMADLAPGERIFASGELVEATGSGQGGGYRGAGKQLVLRPPARGRMLLSSEPLGQRFLARARIHHRWSLGLAALALVFNLIALGYHCRLWAGIRSEGVMTDKRTYITKNKNSTTTHYEITVRILDTEQIFTDEVEGQVWMKLKAGNAIPVIRVPWWDAVTQVGVGPSFHVAVVPGFLILLTFLTIVYVIHALRSRPWYETKLIDRGDGKLPD